MSGCWWLTADIVLPILTSCPALVRLSLRDCYGVCFEDMLELLSAARYSRDPLHNLVLSELNLSLTWCPNGAFLSCGERVSPRSISSLRYALTGRNNQKSLRFDVYPCEVCRETIAPYAPRHCAACPKSVNYLCQRCAVKTLWTCAECTQVSFCPSCNSKSLSQKSTGLMFSPPVQVCQSPMCVGVKQWTCWVCGWYDCPDARRIAKGIPEGWGTDQQMAEYEMRRVSEVCSKCHRGICKTCLAGSSCPCESA